jgi:hypothetical protein
MNQLQQNTSVRAEETLNRKKFEEARDIWGQANKDPAEAERLFKVLRGGEYDEVELAEFLADCSKVRYAIGENEIDRAYERAKRSPVPVQGFDINGPICTLAALCRELQALKDKNPDTIGVPFPLGYRLTAKLLGDISHVTAGKLLRVLEMKQIIRRTSNGSYHPGSTKNESAEFNYLPALKLRGDHSPPISNGTQDEQATSWMEAEQGTSEELPY